MRLGSCLILAISLSACAPSWDNAVRDYQLGRYVAAERALRWYADKGRESQRAEARALLESLEEERERAIDFLLSEATHVRKQAEAQTTSYDAADAFLAAALELMAAKDPRRAKLDKQREVLRERSDARVRSYLDRMNEFGREVAAAGRCKGADWIATVQHLSTAREGAGIEPSRDLLVLFTAEAANKCFELRAYESAGALSDLAEALRDPRSAGSAEVARLAAVVQARLFSEEPIVAQNEAEDLTEAEAQSLVEEPIDRALAASKPKRRRRVRRRSPPAAAPEDTPVEATPPEEIGPDRRQTERRVTSLIAEGSKYEALALLQSLSDAYPDTGWLQALRRRYRQDREKLVEQYLSLGETALQRENPELAFDHYERVLAIDPSNEIARDRKRKIENLRKLRRRQGRN